MRDQLIEAAAAARAEAVEGKPFDQLDEGTRDAHRQSAVTELKLYFAAFQGLGLAIVPKALPDDVAFAVSEEIVVQAEGQQMRLATATVQDYWAGCIAQLAKE